MKKIIILLLFVIVALSIVSATVNLDFRLDVEEKGFYPNEKIPLNVTIVNRDATFAARDAELIIYVSDRFYTFDLEDLEPGETFQKEITLPEFSPGTHNVKGEVNYTGIFDERFIEISYGSFEVLFPPIERYPRNVYVSSYDLPEKILGGKSYDVSITITNDGEVSANLLIEFGSLDEFFTEETTLNSGESTTVKMGVEFENPGISLIEARVYALINGEKYLLNYRGKKTYVQAERKAKLIFDRIKFVDEADNKINQEDIVKFKIFIKNEGETATSVIGELLSTVGKINILDKIVSYLTIPKKDSVAPSEDIFEIETKGIEAGDYELDLKLNYADSEDREKEIKIPITISEGGDTCYKDADCSETQTCENNQCAEVSCECGEVKNHKCYPYECCNDTDCSVGYCNIEQHICMSGVRNLYEKGTVFLVSDRDWHNVIQMVPLTIWTENNNINKYPFLIYHIEDKGFDIDSIIHFLEQYNTERVIFIKEEDTENILSMLRDPNEFSQQGGLEVKEIDIEDQLPNEISKTKKIFISENNYEVSMLCSTMASLNHAILIFESEYNNYKDMIQNKEIYTCGNVNIDIEVTEEFKNIMQLQQKYIEKTKTDKIILVNPNDLNINENEKFITDKGGYIYSLFSKNSLSAPILASAKHELIIFTELEKAPFGNWIKIKENVKSTDDKVESETLNLFSDYNPKYLTIISSPLAIPDAIHDDFYSSKDWLYGSINDKDQFNDDNILMGTGRIYGITIADTSAYVARSIFYDNLFDNIYNFDEYTGIAVGHSFSNYRQNMPKVSQKTGLAGYNTPCFIDIDSSICKKETHPDLSNYKKRQFIVFGDHGYYGGWSSTLSYYEINSFYFDIPYIFTHACATANFWDGGVKMIGLNLIRHGAVSYEGAVISSGNDGLHSSEHIALQYLTSGKKINLGDLSKKLKGEFSTYKRDYMLFGDPTLEPRFKKVNWQ